MTEEEAKSMFCPAKLSMSVGAIKTCSGSKCMAWREDRVPMRENYKWDADGKPMQIVSGYCGLAGAPQ